MNLNKLILPFILLSLNVQADCLDDAISTLDIRDCYIAELKIEEQKLGDMLSKAYKNSDYIIKEIKKSQGDWLRYRKSQCDAVYYSYGSGSMRLFAPTACMVELTKLRQNRIDMDFIKN
jgi:uncharacterized protein YecT (DUF1311 family)